MEVSTATATGRLREHQARAWVEAFADGWRAPRNADQFVAHFEPWLAPDVRLIQPMGGPIVGLRAFRERFARPLFDLVPDLRRTVEGWAASGDTVYIELRLEGTVGGRRVTLRTCDRVKLRDGLTIERRAHLDPLQLLVAIARAPRMWPVAIHQQLAVRRRSS
jgi:ketosteroid isomerase-like protein